jgi:large subunit ribosomal protein L25
VIDAEAIGREFQPHRFPIALHVEDIEAARAELESRGVSFTHALAAASARWPSSKIRTATRSCSTTATRHVEPTPDGPGDLTGRDASPLCPAAAWAAAEVSPLRSRALMERTALTRLDVSGRTPGGSRLARRMRHDGLVPGVLYGGSGEPVSFAVEARALRTALSRHGAVLEVAFDGGRPTPAVLKEAQRHPVRGDTMHVDLVRVRLDQAIQATVSVELLGAEESPGVRDGGVLEHVTHTVLVEALPTEIPESISYDVSAMSIGETLLLSALSAPEGVTLLGDLDEIVIATLSPPRLRLEDEEQEIEQETELVGEAEAGAGGEDADAEKPADAVPGDERE